MPGNKYSPSYIFMINENDIRTVILGLGTKFDRVSEDSRATFMITRNGDGTKNISMAIYCFLFDTELVDKSGRLSKDGRSYFEAMYVYDDKNAANLVLKKKLLQNPIVNLIGQVFYGRGKIRNEQLQILLNYQRVASREITLNDVESLLTLLHVYGIIEYDKNEKTFYLEKPISAENPIKQYYVSPETPFSNIYNFRRVLRCCQGDVFWIDKHFRKEGFEIIVDGLAFEGVKSFTIISGEDNVTESAKADYRQLKQELNFRNIELSWRIIDESSFKLHDRWIVADNCCYNIPPVLAVIRGQRSDIINSESILDVKPFIQNSICIESHMKD